MIESSHADHRTRSFPNNIVDTAAESAKRFLDNTTSDDDNVADVTYGCVTDHAAHFATVQAHLEICSGLSLQFVDPLASDAEEKFTKARIVFFTPLRAGDCMHQPYIQLLLFRKLGSPAKRREIACIVTERT